MPIFINGKIADVPLENLIAEGKAIIGRENVPPSKFFSLEAHAASIAVSRYDQAHREWVDANESETKRK